MMMMMMMARRRRKKKEEEEKEKKKKKKAQKIPIYKDLTIKIQRMWKVKTKVIPVIIGATETISKSFRKYVSNIPGNHEVKKLQKTAILGTAHILRKVLT
jgi:MinD-like ATPase involved in chromosome partitioning or flagellar assembly